MKKSIPVPTRTKPESTRGLAARLGCSPAAIRSWRQRFPTEVPSGYDVKEWRQFQRKHGVGVPAQRSAGKDLEALRRKRIDVLDLQCRRLRAELAISSRQAVSLAAVDAAFKQLAERVRMELYNQLESILPPKLEGQSVAQMRQVLRESADTICGRMRDFPIELGEEKETP